MVPPVKIICFGSRITESFAGTETSLARGISSMLMSYVAALAAVFVIVTAVIEAVVALGTVYSVDRLVDAAPR